MKVNGRTILGDIRQKNKGYKVWYKVKTIVAGADFKWRTTEKARVNKEREREREIVVIRTVCCLQYAGLYGLFVDFFRFLFQSSYYKWREGKLGAFLFDSFHYFCFVTLFHDNRRTTTSEERVREKTEREETKIERESCNRNRRTERNNTETKVTN